MPDAMSDYLLVSESARFLQNGMAGRNILTVLYLVILTLCFVTPIFYYFRLHCQDHQLQARNRRLEEAYVADIVQASVEEQSETRAMRKKYRAERRARIIQLFAPVSMVSLFDVCAKKNVIVVLLLKQLIVLDILPLATIRFSGKSTSILLKMKRKKQLKIWVKMKSKK